MLQEYKKAAEQIKSVKEKILHHINKDFHDYRRNKDNKMKSGVLYFANLSDLTTSWLPEDIYNNVLMREKGLKTTNQKFGEIVSLEQNIMNSKDVIATLSKMLQLKNCTKVDGYYFASLSEYTLDRIAEILLDDFQPSYGTRNIKRDAIVKDRDVLVERRTKEIDDAYKRIESAKQRLGLI